MSGKTALGGIVDAALRGLTPAAQRSTAITHFTPTSSPALDRLLNDIRTKIILPAYLPEKQRQKIYSQRWEKRLQADPIIMEIDGEVIKFRYQNRGKDIPRTNQSIADAVQQFQTPADFANLKPLLEGVAYTGRRLPVDFEARLLRIVGDKGRIYSLIECARSARRGRRPTYRLDTLEKVTGVLHYVQLKARDADWDEAETRQALRWADLVIEMLHEDIHQPRRFATQPPVRGELHPARDPMVRAAHLHLAAALVARHEVPDDEIQARRRAKVHRIARDLVAVWPQDKKLREVQPPGVYRRNYQLGYLLDPNKFLVIAAPLLHGLDTAIKVVEPELSYQLSMRRDALAAEVQEARDALAAKRQETGKNKKFLGEEVYSKFYDDAA